MRFFHYFNFERDYDVLKLKSPYFLLNKNINFNKNERKSKMENLGDKNNQKYNKKIYNRCEVTDISFFNSFKQSLKKCYGGKKMSYQVASKRFAHHNPTNTDLFKIINRNTRKSCEICSKF